MWLVSLILIGQVSPSEDPVVIRGLASVNSTGYLESVCAGMTGVFVEKSDLIPPFNVYWTFADVFDALFIGEAGDNCKREYLMCDVEAERGDYCIGAPLYFECPADAAWLPLMGGTAMFEPSGCLRIDFESRGYWVREKYEGHNCGGFQQACMELNMCPEASFGGAPYYPGGTCGYVGYWNGGVGVDQNGYRRLDLAVFNDVLCADDCQDLLATCPGLPLEVLPGLDLEYGIVKTFGDWTFVIECSGSPVMPVYAVAGGKRSRMWLISSWYPGAEVWFGPEPHGGCGSTLSGACAAGNVCDSRRRMIAGSDYLSEYLSSVCSEGRAYVHKYYAVEWVLNFSTTVGGEDTGWVEKVFDELADIEGMIAGLGDGDGFDVPVTEKEEALDAVETALSGPQGPGGTCAGGSNNGGACVDDTGCPQGVCVVSGSGGELYNPIHGHPVVSFGDALVTRVRADLQNGANGASPYTGLPSFTVPLGDLAEPLGISSIDDIILNFDTVGQRLALMGTGAVILRKLATLLAMFQLLILNLECMLWVLSMTQWPIIKSMQGWFED